MNRKRREKKQAQASGTKPVTLDFETCSSVPLDWGKAELYAVDEFGKLERLGVLKSFKLFEHAANAQLATYAFGALHDNMELWDKMKSTTRDFYVGDCHIGQTVAMDLGTEAHRRLDAYCKWDTHHVMHGGDMLHGPHTNTIADTDYSTIEERVMADLNKRLTDTMMRAYYGIDLRLWPYSLFVNHDENKAIDKATELATSASRITIAKVAGND